MTTRAEGFTNTSAELMAKAEDALSQGDLLRASEKAWGAAAHMVKAVAERRRWRHTGHRELFQVVSRLAEETGDRAYTATSTRTGCRPSLSSMAWKGSGTSGSNWSPLLIQGLGRSWQRECPESFR